MPSEHRIVEIARGHRRKLRRAVGEARPGCILVRANSHHAPFEIDPAKWDAAAPPALILESTKIGGPA